MTRVPLNAFIAELFAETREVRLARSILSQMFVQLPREVEARMVLYAKKKHWVAELTTMRGRASGSLWTCPLWVTTWTIC